MVQTFRLIKTELYTNYCKVWWRVAYGMGFYGVGNLVKIGFNTTGAGYVNILDENLNNSGAKIS